MWDLNEPILDVGTGRGGLSTALALKRVKIFGTDIDFRIMKDLNNELSDMDISDSMQLFVADAECLPFADGSFAGVVCFNLLHHLQTYEPSITEMVRVLANGGKLLIADFTYDGFRKLEDHLLNAKGKVHKESGCKVDKAVSLLQTKGMILVDDVEIADEQIVILKKVL